MSFRWFFIVALLTILLLGGWQAWQERHSVSEPLFLTPNTQLEERYSREPPQATGWADLLPENELATLKKYQPNDNEPLHKQIFQTLQASFSDDYQSVQHSTRTVDTLNNQSVTLNGYIVPLETDDHHRVLSFFLVPYFGACIHFPPPAPNQMVYVRLSTGFTLADINSAYTVSGILHNAMFEDPSGTSAYVLEAVIIDRFSGQPDDVRNHTLQTS